MTDRYVTHYCVEERDGAFAVDAVTKKYGSLGPDPGRETHRVAHVEGVDREYAEMLARELTKMAHDVSARVYGHVGDNIFDIRHAVSRTIDMWTGPNADEWADNPRLAIVY